MKPRDLPPAHAIQAWRRPNTKRSHEHAAQLLWPFASSLPFPFSLFQLEIPPAARLFTAAATLAAVPVPRPRRTPPARRSSGSLNLAGTRPNRLFSMYRPPNAFGVPLQHPPPQPSPWQWQQPPEPSPAVSFWQSDNVRDHVKKLQGTIEVSTALINELEEITATRNSGDAVAQESDLYSMELSSESADSSVDKP
ncbi:unnamed protein product, partial [Urochloa humidicola]